MVEGTMTLLPPAPGRCQICGAKHEDDLPHNAQSLYYQMSFEMEHDRAPNWIDAMAHCSEEMRAIWRAELMKCGVDVDGGQVNPSGLEAKRFSPGAPIENPPMASPSAAPHDGGSDGGSVDAASSGGTAG